MSKLPKTDISATAPEPQGQAESAVPAVAASEGTGAVMYLGPRLLAPVHLAPHTVFRGGLPAEIAALAAEDADLRACLVPVERAGQAMRGEGAAALATAATQVANRYSRRK
ncbi:hypothetical protein SAMN04488503_3010 [Humidesulfovibrio mexicanus]|uniref:Uncharacterized protein n=1 Tax=Humidesulfovibrio mexicanus TaxID=147047 RepID=A0A239CAG3_9BACT|nr:hypothetical protein [Humidesulfovibrio mexicanus]SNS16454.1 hypothetical protein SAMN04488503_3010 [Humidesulfovibrio mexicanus]